jgi:hypothetical protein
LALCAQAAREDRNGVPPPNARAIIPADRFNKERRVISLRSDIVPSPVLVHLLLFQ